MANTKKKEVVSPIFETVEQKAARGKKPITISSDGEPNVVEEKVTELTNKIMEESNMKKSEVIDVEAKIEDVKEEIKEAKEEAEATLKEAVNELKNDCDIEFVPDDFDEAAPAPKKKLSKKGKIGLGIGIGAIVAAAVGAAIWFFCGDEEDDAEAEPA